MPDTLTFGKNINILLDKQQISIFSLIFYDYQVFI